MFNLTLPCHCFYFASFVSVEPLAQPSRPTSAPAAGAEPDDRGFIAKYWMYMLPFVLMSLVSAIMSPQEPEPAPADGAPAAAATSAAARGPKRD
jgi:hypothetical protein